MIKKIIAASAALAMTVSLSSAAIADDGIIVLVNGNSVEFTDAAPFIENDRTLVPMRAIFEALGAQVSWDEEMKTVVSYDPVSDTSITMQIDSDKMFVGESEAKLDVAAKIVDDRTFVPLRAVAEGMQSEVKWDGETKTVTIQKEIPSEDVQE